MELVRTTIRLPKELKKQIQKKAFEEETTFQDFLIETVEIGLKTKLEAVKKPRMKFAKLNLGGLDNLTRSDYYDEPDFEKFSR